MNEPGRSYTFDWRPEEHAEVTALLLRQQFDAGGWRALRWVAVLILVLATVVVLASAFLGDIGSVLTDEFNDRSDVDVLVEFLPGHTPGLAFFAMQDELTELLKRPVDLHTPNFLSRHFRAEVIAKAEYLYVAA